MATLDGLVREDTNPTIDLDLSYNHPAVYEPYNQHRYCDIRVFQLAADLVILVHVQYYNHHILLHVEHIFLERYNSVINLYLLIHLFSIIFQQTLHPAFPGSSGSIRSRRIILHLETTIECHWEQSWHPVYGAIRQWVTDSCFL